MTHAKFEVIAKLIICAPVNRCVSAPHDGMRRRRREIHGLRGLLRSGSGRVAGSRGRRWRSDPSQAAALEPTKLGGCGHCKWPTKRVQSAECATRGDERRNRAAHGHGISLGVFRTALVLGVGEAGSVSWRSRARRLVGSGRLGGLTGRQLTGPVRQRPRK